jgi:hypothetical protein
MKNIMAVMVLAVLFCSRCHLTIWDGDDFYAKRDKGQVVYERAYGPENYEYMEDIICRRCYRILPSNEQDFYQKVRTK